MPAALLLLAAALGGLTEDELQRVLAGETPVRSETFTSKSGRSAGRAVGAIVVDRPAAAVFAVLARYEDKAEYMPRLERVTVLEKSDTQVRAIMEVDVTLRTVRYTGLFTVDEPSWTVSWTLDPATSADEQGIAETEGQWQAFQIEPERTLLVYWTYVDSGRAVPKAIEGYLTTRSLPDLLAAVKRRVESGGAWSKD